ncbi:MAG: holo-ACP synthase [Candidatus Nanopelagicales bacterium]
MIVGIGVDLVNVAKFGANVTRTPGFAGVLFTDRERSDELGQERSIASLAARYAAKEATAKALGVPPGTRWHDCEVLAEPDGRPYVHTRGHLAEAAAELGVAAFHLSLAMEGDVAIAYVVAEGSASLDGVRARRMVETA